MANKRFPDLEPRSRVTRGSLGGTVTALLGLLAAATVAPPAAEAQRAGAEMNPCAVDSPIEVLQQTGELVQPTSCAPSPFQLRGPGDFAGSGMRSKNANIEYWVTNTGFSDSGRELQGLTLPFYITDTYRANNVSCCWLAQNYELQWYAAAARGDWARNRELAPQLQNVIGGGWTRIVNVQRTGVMQQLWEGSDGSVGRLHSGAQAGPEGCLDHGPYYRHYPYGMPLLAGSDCPATWGSEGWKGRRWIGGPENWKEYRNAVGADDFNWDFWRVPEDFHQTEKNTVGDFQVFGSATDHGSRVTSQYYGSVAGGSGDPVIEGYPIGLKLYFNAMSFAAPAVSNGYLYEILMVNESESLYGVPLDYDSLYFGVQNRVYRINQRGRPSAVPERGLVTVTELGDPNGRTNCHGANRWPVSCVDTWSTADFRGGGQGVMIMKSPLGDLRNKLFSDPSSDFYSPGHPLAGDTVTYNHMRMCGFACITQNFPSARRGFGILSAQSDHALGGQDPQGMTDRQNYDLFHSFYLEDGVTPLYCDPANPRGPGCYSFHVPGQAGSPHPEWNYTNRPPGTAGGPDTLWIDNCRPPTSNHPAANQCVALYSDTLPDKTLNWTYNNFFAGAGPFPLAAGDTTSFVVAIFAEPDSIRYEAAVQGWYDFYLRDFYLGPGIPPPPAITRVAVQGGSYFYDEPEITLFLDDAAESYRDPFALKILEDFRNPAPGSFAENVIQADPGAADRLESLIFRNTVDTIYVFKSCDLARTVTAQRSVECEPSRARDAAGNTIGTGWQAYDILLPDEDGRFPKTWTDQIAVGGKTYMYSLQAVTQGIALPTRYEALLEDESGGTEIRDTVLQITPPGRTNFGFRTANPWVVDVYVPASNQAGRVAAEATLLRQEGPVNWARHFDITFLPDIAEGGTFQLVFAEDATILEYRSQAGAEPDSTRIVLHRSTDAVLPDGTVGTVPLPETRYLATGAGGVTVSVDEQEADVSTTVQGGTVITVTEANEPVGVLLDAAGQPLFLSSDLEGEDFMPATFMGHPRFPEFFVSIDLEGGEFGGINWVERTNNPEEPLIPLHSQSWPSVTFDDDESEAVGPLHGRYYVTWGAPIFGMLADLPLMDLTDPQNTAAAYTQLLEQRPVASQTEVTPEILAAIQRDIDPSITMDDLIQVKLPIERIRNVAFDADESSQGETVRIAMLRSSKISTVVLGQAPDSVTATVPEDVWIPGEPLILLEEVELAETNPDGTVRLDASGRPITRTDLRVTFSEATLSCQDTGSPATCNPVRGPGQASAPGYVEVRWIGHPDYPLGWEHRFTYDNPLTSSTVFEFEISPSQVGERVARLTQADLSNVRVVPNPYLGRSEYEYVGSVRRIMFTSLPPSGTIQIFTASGQFVQQLNWEPQDLKGNGDMFWGMQTHEGTEIAPGLYLYVIQAKDPESGAELRHGGKFVIIK